MAKLREWGGMMSCVQATDADGSSFSAMLFTWGVVLRSVLMMIVGCSKVSLSYDRIVDEVMHT